MRYNITDTETYASEGTELMGIELLLGNKQRLTIINIYCSDKKLNITKTIEMLHKETNCILIGDWNAKIDTPFHNTYNENGINLQSAYENNELKIIAPDAFTRFDPAGRNPSCIDFMVTQVKTNFMITSVIIGDDVGSDHRPVTYTISVNEMPARLRISPYPNFLKADWEAYRKYTDEQTKIMLPVAGNKESIDQSIKNLTELIQDADHKFIPRKKYIPSKYPLPLHIIDMIHEKRKLRNLSQNDKRLHLLTKNDIKRKINYLKKRIDKEIKIYRREELDKIWTQTENKTPYGFCKLAKRMSGENTINKTTYPIQDQDSKLLKDDTEKAETFRKLYDEIYSTPKTNDGNIKRLHKTIDRFAKEITEEFQAVKPRVNDIDIDVAVDSNDIQKHLKRSKNTSPGPDKITYLHLKQLPPSTRDYLASIFSICLQCAYFPDRWKEGITILLPKPGKDNRLTKNYRPITLLPTMGQTLERLINGRLQKIIETNKHLPDSQAGFRENRSTQDQLLRLVESIATGFQIGNITLACYHDIEKAFDKMWTNGLLYKLQTVTKFRRNTIGLICSFLSNRSVKFKINDVLSHPLSLNAGTPQGAILSPTLFNLWVSDIPQPSGKHKKAQLSQFADDIAAWATARTIETARSTLQEYNNSLVEWCKKWKISLSPHKTQLVCYSKKEPQSLACAYQYVDNIRIEAVKEAKFLGITIDKRLKFKTQQEETLKTLTTKVARFSVITGSVNFPRASQNTGLRILKSMIIPLTGYAHTIAVMYSDAYFNKQDQLIQRGARKALHVPKTISREYVIQTAKLTPSKETTLKNGHNYINNEKRSDVIKALVANKNRNSRRRRTFEGPLDKLFCT